MVPTWKREPDPETEFLRLDVPGTHVVGRRGPRDECPSVTTKTGVGWVRGIVSLHRHCSPHDELEAWTLGWSDRRCWRRGWGVVTPLRGPWRDWGKRECGTHVGRRMRIEKTEIIRVGVTWGRRWQGRGPDPTPWTKEWLERRWFGWGGTLVLLMAPEASVPVSPETNGGPT